MTAGRPTNLDDELFLKIEELVLDGKNMAQIAEILDIPYKTMEGWKTRNYEGFRDKMLNFQLQEMFRTSLVQIRLKQESEDERVNLQANLEVAKRIGKKYFSERTEVTGKDGEAITIIFDEAFKSKLNAITPKTTGDSQEYSEI